MDYMKLKEESLKIAVRDDFFGKYKYTQLGNIDFVIAKHVMDENTQALFDEFVDAFEDTDVLILTDIYAAREKDVYNISSYKLMSAMKHKYPDREIYYVKDFEDIVSYINKFAGKDDIAMTMGAGDVYKVGEMLLAKE